MTSPGPDSVDHCTSLIRLSLSHGARLSLLPPGGHDGAGGGGGLRGAGLTGLTYITTHDTHNQDQTRGACLGPLSHLSDLTIKTTSSRPQLGFVPFLDNLLQIELYNWLI